MRGDRWGGPGPTVQQEMATVSVAFAICYLRFAILSWPPLSSGVFTKPEILLRIEGALDLALSLIFFEAIQGNWLLFILLLLVPDLAMLGYLRGPDSEPSVTTWPTRWRDHF